MIQSDFSIEHIKRESSYTMQYFHNHDSYEIYYLSAGERQYFIQDTSYAVRTGDIVLINRQQLHKTIESGTNLHERILINFKESFVSQSNDNLDLFSLFHSNQHVLSLSTLHRQTIEQMLYSMLHEFNEKPHDYELFLQSTLTQLLIMIKRIAKESPLQRNDNAMTHNKKAIEIVQYLQHHFQKPFKLEELSTMFDISPYHLCRSFKQYTGFTLVEYLQQIRIRAAQKLLVDTQAQVQVIAEEVGFNSIIHFNRVFKHITGVPPSFYRRSRTLTK